MKTSEIVICIYFLVNLSFVSAQDPCSKYVTSTMDKEFHKTWGMIKPVKIPVNDSTKIQFLMTGDKETGSIILSVLGSNICIIPEAEVLIAFEDNTSKTFHFSNDTCKTDGLLLFIDIGVNLPALQSPIHLVKFRESKIRGINIETNKGILSAPLTEDAKDFIYNSAKCMGK